jgi:hypothetical protein
MQLPGDFCEDKKPRDELVRIEKVDEVLAGLAAELWRHELEGLVTPTMLLRIRRDDEPAS